MIMVDWQIKEWAENGGIHPLDLKLINPASVDLRAGTQWIDMQYPKMKYTSTPTVYAASISTLLHNAVIDTIHNITYNTKLLMQRKPTAILLETYETVTLPKNMAAEIKLKTTPTREGLNLALADWVDNGFTGQLTLMIMANKTITIKPGHRICQLVLHRTKTVNVSYAAVGHYQNQKGATTSWRQE